MRCNQVTIKIERFGEYVPENYPADTQCIEVYCDDSQSIYAALSKAYAMAVNELNEYEPIGVRTDVSTNEFSHIDYRKMRGTIPKMSTRYEQDIALEYNNIRLPVLKDYVWVYEHSNEIMEVIKNAGKEDFAPALKERFGLDDVQVRKLSQIRLDMLDRDRYESVKQEIDELEKKMTDAGKEKTEHKDFIDKTWKIMGLRREIGECESEVDVINAYFTAAEHYEDILRAMMDTEDPEEYMDYMKRTYGFSYEQSRAIRYAPANYYGKQERIKQERRLERLQKDIDRYKEWIKEIEEELKENGQD